MANLNRVMLIGRLTRKPEEILVGGVRNGAKFGFAVNNRKFNQDTQTWVDVPVFLEVEIWNRGENKQADRVLQTLRGPSPDRESGLKASQIFIEGHLRMDEWTDQATQKKRTKIVVVVDSFQYLEAKQGGGMEGDEEAPRPSRQASPPRSNTRPATAPRAAAASEPDDFGGVDDEPAPPRGGRGRAAEHDESDIPF
jgi:single-strand DNA-binding protein